MTKPLYKQYENARPLGVYELGAWYGLVILDIDHGNDQVIAAFDYCGKYQNVRRHKINMTYTGRAYIRKGGRRYYFDQINRL